MRADAVVVGSGLAGLIAAVELEGMRVVVITRAALGDGASSAWAQGGIAAALGSDDSPELHARDTVTAGAGLVDVALAGELAREAPLAIERMIALGARLDRGPDGALAMGREAAHSRRRILHADGDATGRELLRAAESAVLAARNIAVCEYSTLIDLVGAEGTVSGIRFLDALGRMRTILAPRVVLATGGLGALYRFTTNPRGQWGAGIAVAARAGATLADLEFVQFHPTALRTDADPLPLVSEAVRGEGATLIDERGRALMADVDTRGDLAPRDVVARAVYRAMQAGHRVFLDARERPGANFPERFPGIFAACARASIDPRLQPIPIVAAAHYHMGGIAVDGAGRTSLRGLWACGEVAATGVHGANRLASNSLLEALVFARRVARDIASTQASRTAHSAPAERSLPYETDADGEHVAAIRDRMFRDVGIEREGSALRKVAGDLSDLAHGAASQSVQDMATVGALIASSALARRESRGSHYRTDFPQASAGAERSFVQTATVSPLPIPA